MKESLFVGNFEAAAKDILGDNAVVRRGANLYYSLSLNRRLELSVKTQIPKRGSSAFQTDICIFEKADGLEFPRLVIEFKERITTHDILTYSSKAGKHKQIYPCLRYGLLVSEQDTIPKRFFIHNENLDFFIAAKNYKKQADVRKLAKGLIEDELKTSKILESIHFSGKKVNYYCRKVVFRDFKKIAP